MQVIALLISFIPYLFLFFYFRNRKKDETYKKICNRLLVDGLLCFGMIFVLDLIINIILNVLHLKDINPIFTDFLRTFIINALVEEYVKFYNTNKRINLNNIKYSYLDLMAFYSIVAIGFALIEDVIYVFDTNIIQILVRGVTGLHAGLGLMIGYYTAKKIVTGDKKYGVIALALPIFLHGSYNFFLSEHLSSDIQMMVLIFLFATMFIGIKLLVFMHKHRNDEEYNKILNA